MAGQPLAPKTELGIFPAEIWHLICCYTASSNVINLRLVCKRLAGIAAEFSITEVRFDTSSQSFARLRDIAHHEGLRKGITTLTYEAGLLDDVGCIHSYKRHFDLEHHRADRPRPPQVTDQSARAERLYKRNIAKWETDLENRYQEYRQAYDTQQALIDAPKELLFSCVSNFPNLQKVIFKTGGYCLHSMSAVFRKKYCNDCAVPLSNDTGATVWQLENILQPGIIHLSARQVSPKLFDGQGKRSKEWLQSRFASLEHVQIMFKDELEFHHGSVIVGQSSTTPMLKNSLLSQALSVAQSLKFLTINFSPNMLDAERSAGNLFDVLGKNSFPKLTHLDVDFVSSTEDYLIQALKAQPKLYGLYLAFIVLTEGDWAQVLSRMRLELKLEEVLCNGIFEDSERTFSTDLYERSAWEDGIKTTLREAIDLYVTDPDYYDHNIDADEEDQEFADMCNPIRRIDFDYEDEEDLTLDFGSILDSEDDSSDGDDDDDDDTDESEDDANAAYRGMPGGFKSDDEDQEMPDVADTVTSISHPKDTSMEVD